MFSSEHSGEPDVNTPLPCPTKGRDPALKFNTDCVLILVGDSIYACKAVYGYMWVTYSHQSCPFYLKEEINCGLHSCARSFENGGLERVLTSNTGVACCPVWSDTQNMCPCVNSAHMC